MTSSIRSRPIIIGLAIIAALGFIVVAFAALYGETTEEAEPQPSASTDNASAGKVGTEQVGESASSYAFGDDTSEYANDGECDDARFVGAGMDGLLLTDSIGRDATDCKAAFASKTITVNRLHVIPTDSAPIIFGDNNSEYASDGQCDDIRFVGKDVDETVFLYEDVGHDSADCKAAFEAGTVKWQGDSATPERGEM